jgi:hypothetical protein
VKEITLRVSEDELREALQPWIESEFSENVTLESVVESREVDGTFVIRLKPKAEDAL